MSAESLQPGQAVVGGPKLNDDRHSEPDALVIVDAQYEDTAIKEAKRLDIPVIAIVDSNTDPNKVDHAIPANDDSMRTIQLIISAIADSIIETKEASGKGSDKKDIDQNSSSDKNSTNTKSTDS